MLSGTQPARPFTQLLNPHGSIYDSRLAESGAQNQPFVAVKNVSFLTFFFCWKTEAEKEKERCGMSYRFISSHVIYASFVDRTMSSIHCGALKDTFDLL